MRCNNCGNELNSTAKFCCECGYPVEDKTEHLINGKTCSCCGAVINDDALFCNICGNKIDIFISTNANKCVKCGNNLRDGAVFCNYCGKLIEKKENNIVTLRDNHSVIVLWAIALIIVIIICSTVIYFVLSTNMNYPSFNELSLIGEVADVDNNEINKSFNEEETEVKTTLDIEEESVKEDKEYGLPVFDLIRATSELESEGSNTYYAENILDGIVETAWVEGVEEYGIGEYISFSSNTPQKVSGIKILNGYCKTNELYNQNSRVKKIEITFSDGTTIEKNLHDDFCEFNDIKLQMPIICNEIRIKILETYNGTKYADTCISEVEFY